MSIARKLTGESLERLGLTVWVQGEPVGKIKGGNLVGTPKCSNCEASFELGLTLKGGQNICRGCLDGLRRLLFDLLHDKLPRLFKRDP